MAAEGNAGCTKILLWRHTLFVQEYLLHLGPKYLQILLEALPMPCTPRTDSEPWLFASAQDPKQVRPQVACIRRLVNRPFYKASLQCSFDLEQQAENLVTKDMTGQLLQTALLLVSKQWQCHESGWYDNLQSRTSYKNAMVLPE